MKQHHRPMVLVAVLVLFSFSATADILDDFEKMNEAWQAFGFKSRAEAFGADSADLEKKIHGEEGKLIFDAIKGLDDAARMAALSKKFSQFQNAMRALKEKGVAEYALQTWGKDDPRTKFAHNGLFRDAARDILRGETVEGLLTILDKDVENWREGDAELLFRVFDQEKITDGLKTPVEKLEVANELIRLHAKIWTPETQGNTWARVYSRAHDLYKAAYAEANMKNGEAQKVARAWLNGIGNTSEKNEQRVLDHIEGRFDNPVEAMRFLVPDGKKAQIEELEEMIPLIARRAKAKGWTPRDESKALEMVQFSARVAQNETGSPTEYNRFSSVEQDVVARRLQVDPPFRTRVAKTLADGKDLNTAITRALPEVEKIQYEDLGDLAKRLPDGFSKVLTFDQAMMFARTLHSVLNATHEKSGMSFDGLHGRLNHLFHELATRQPPILPDQRAAMLAEYLEMSDYDGVGGKRRGTEKDVANLLKAMDAGEATVSNAIARLNSGDNSMAEKRPAKFRTAAIDLINHLLEQKDFDGAGRVAKQVHGVAWQRHRYPGGSDPIWEATRDEMNRLGSIADMDGNQWKQQIYSGNYREAFESLARAYELGRMRRGREVRKVQRPGDGGPRTLGVHIADIEDIEDIMKNHRGDLRKLPTWQLEDIAASLEKLPIDSARRSNALGEIHEHILRHKDNQHNSEKRQQALTNSILARDPYGRYTEPAGELLPELLRKNLRGFQNGRPVQAFEDMKSWLAKEGAGIAKSPAWTKALIGSIDVLFPGDTPDAIADRKDLLDTFQRAADAEATTDVDFRAQFNTGEEKPKLKSAQQQLADATRAADEELTNSKKLLSRIGRFIRRNKSSAGSVAGACAVGLGMLIGG